MFAGVLALGSVVSGCAQKNVLVGQGFIGTDKTVKILMTQPVGEGDDRVVNQIMRVCTLKDGTEADCKDTLAIENVRPGSLY